MFINFLHPELEPSVECNTISSEGHEISNLISSNQIEFQKGFLAERFISGPVIISARCLCPINIKYIIIWSKVSNQKSLGFELTSLKHCDQARNEVEFKRFVSGVIDNNADGIVLHKEGLQISSEKHTPEVQSFTRRSFLRSKYYENVAEIRIKIFKSQYVPAIKKIEIWGEPSSSCDRETRAKVRRLWFQIRRKLATDRVPASNYCDNEVVKNISPLGNVSIPEEFHDEITNEVMTLPMILPSGKIIDERTLEKFQNEEARWGRPPSDPFTGIIFSDRCKPVIATVLKAKIDAYLLANSDLDIVKTLPRRLGSAVSSADFKVSKIVDEKVTLKRKVSAEEDRIGKIRIRGNCEHRSKSDPSACNERLEQILQGLPSFLSAPEPVRKICVSCIECSISEQLYTLPCIHIMCRACIIRNAYHCKPCDKNFTFAEVQKMHVLGPHGSL